MEIQTLITDERGLPLSFLIGSNSLFFPLLGDREKTIMNFLHDFKEECNITPVLITSFPEIEGFDINIPFETIRLTPKVEYNRNLLIYLNTVKKGDIDEVEFVNTLKNRFDIDLYNSNQWDDLIELANVRKPFDYFLAIDDWADAELCMLVKNNLVSHKIHHYLSDTITMRVYHEFYDYMKGKTNCDVFLHSCPYECIKNKGEDGEDNKYNLQLYSKTFISDLNGDFTKYKFQWDLRPYDYIYYYPSIDNGSPIVLNLALNYPTKKFLILESNDMKNKSYNNYGYWLENLKKLDNVDIIKNCVNLKDEFLRLGKFLLYPSILDSMGWLPLEAGMQGAIPICSDTGILRHSVGPFSEFVYDESITFNPNDLFLDKSQIHNLDFLNITKSWLEKIDFLDNNPLYVSSLFDNLKYIENYVNSRSDIQRHTFRQNLYLSVFGAGIPISDNL